jgi:hypothetical protein
LLIVGPKYQWLKCLADLTTNASNVVGRSRIGGCRRAYFLP